MTQREALDILKLGHNVFLTGAAGSGKTFVLNQFIAHLRKHKIGVGVTASTGIAATHLGGMTIHSWAGIGIKDSLSQSDLDKLLTKSRLKTRFATTKVLIIDEISMLHGERLDMIDQVCRAFKDGKKPFGGLQIVLSGDLFQLPPVTKDRKPPDFVHKSRAWRNMKLNVCYLNEQHRQDDDQLLSILSAIRTNKVDESHFLDLQDKFREPPEGSTVTRLYTHNSAVDVINQDELKRLKTNEQTYLMTSKGSKKIVETMVASCLAPQVLVLKLGTEVMFVSNNPKVGYVNGTRGKVVGFDDETHAPLVASPDKTYVVEPFSWQLIDGEKVVAQISQLPLRLAWAITIHKSQGMSLDAAEIDLSKSFEPGMGYVALSRVRNLDGLYIKGMNNQAMVVHPEILVLDKSLISKSANAVASLESMESDQIKKHHNKVISALAPPSEEIGNYDSKLFNELRDWRYGVSKKKTIPPYAVLNDKTLRAIAAELPKDEKELTQLPGIGPAKLKQYGKIILRMVKPYR